MSGELRALIVEDSADDAALLVRELKRGGFSVDFLCVETPEALRHALEGAPGDRPWGIVIADFSLPKLSGLDALRLLKETGQDIPFILISGAVSEDIAVSVMKAGAQDFITKGNLSRLVPAVERELKEAAHRGGRRRMEEEVRAINERLVHANKMASLGTLASGVAHEINNPNNYIMLNAELLSDAWKDAAAILEGYYRSNGDFMLGGLPFSEMKKTVPELLSGIADGARRIKDIVDGLKDFSRIESADLHREFDVNRAVDAAVRLLSNEITRYTDIFTFAPAADLPPVKGSAQRIEQVIINLIMNSLHALGGRGRGVWLGTFYDAATDSVIIKVKDEGGGMPKEVAVRATEPFFTTKTDMGGTGLGLSISYSIIKEHGGALEFESAPGIGTIAMVRLPAASRAGQAQTGQG
ncbi:MAG: hybrid sensor histidine kinase/response regulator [Deltaproteobacteria bacterium]|nr:hybrid sensor histidine kinase/response regulator [Deltaproteobacteria bacterium]